MPEALARSDHDFTISARPDAASARRGSKAAGADAARGAAQRAAAKPPKPVARSGLIGILTARPARSIAGAAIAAIALGIVVNALALQKARHPAPLFVVAAPVTDIAGKSAAALASSPVPVPRPATGGATPVLDQADKTATVDHAALARHTGQDKDAIAQLLRPHIAQPGKEVAKNEPSQTVLKAQQALLKLGFALKPDGVFGGTTRQAIERFERDRGLPVKGDLTPGIRRQLMAQSGIAIQ